MIKTMIRAALLLLALTSAAYAQTVPPGFNYGDVPTAGQWNFAWASKQDNLGFVPLNSAGGTMSGPLGTTASKTSAAGLNVAPGVAPTSPTDGDLWVTTAGVYAQVNGVTTGPFGAAGANQTINTGTGLTGGPCTTATCGISLSTPVSVANGGTNCTDLTCLSGAMGLGTMSTQNANAIAATGGTIDGTAIGGTTKAAGAFTTLSATTPMGVPSGGLGVGSLTANGPVLGNGTSAVTQGTRSGNTTVFATSTGTLNSGHCVDLDGSGNYVDAGGDCGLPALTADLNLYVRTAPATVTISIASPAVVSWTAHGLSVGSPVVFNTTGLLPTGLTIGTVYYVIAPGLTTNSFEFSATLGGSAVDTTGTQSGTQSAQTGDDAHDCSAATVADACLTIQRTVTIAQGRSLNGHTVTSNLADGVYVEDVSVVGLPGQVEPEGSTAIFLISGDSISPSSVVIQGTTASVGVSDGAIVGVDGVTVQGGQFGLFAVDKGVIEVAGIDFGPTSITQAYGTAFGKIQFAEGYSITGSSPEHWDANNNGIVDASVLTGQTITIIGTPDFSSCFACADTSGSVLVGTSVTFSGSATGPRYNAYQNGVITTFGSGTSYLPGDTPGTTLSGGQYDDTTSTTFFRPFLTTVGSLATVDPSPQSGDMLSVSDATTCVANTTPTGSGSTQCSLVYSGTAWKAIVTF